MRTNPPTAWEPTRRSNDVAEFENVLCRKIVGQDQAVEKAVEIYPVPKAGIFSRPAAITPASRESVIGAWTCVSALGPRLIPVRLMREGLQ